MHHPLLCLADFTALVLNFSYIVGLVLALRKQ